MTNWRNRYKKDIQKALLDLNGYAPTLKSINIADVYDKPDGETVINVWVGKQYYIVTLIFGGVQGTYAHHVEQ